MQESVSQRFPLDKHATVPYCQFYNTPYAVVL
jgi:hypothetical protein